MTHTLVCRSISFSLSPGSCPTFARRSFLSSMASKYIIGSLAGSFVIAYACDVAMSDQKIFGGTTPSTVLNKEWFQETDRKMQAWPRTAGPPVVMNPISRQNFIIKSTDS